jgi:uncharacterized zinc-type alcohol dehydrogenase-like protein
MPFHAYAADAKGGSLKPFDYDPGDLGPAQVEVKVEHCGICHSDLSMLDNEWGMTAYPFVGGHEAVGTIEAVGDDVRDLKVGQRVGVGWQSGCCTHCKPCRRGKEHLCVNDPEQTIIHRHGAFADRVRIDGRWAVPIPDALDPGKAGPLMCAGTTVWSPMRHFGVQPGDEVAIVGIGGLGHLAVQFAHKIGCQVTAISTTHDKEDEARQLGASDFIASKEDGEDAIKDAAGRFDFILSTVSADLPWDQYVNALAPEGQLCICGVPDGGMTVTPFNMILAERSIVGGRAGAPGDTAEMMQFCADKGVEPMCEDFGFDKINDAMDRLRHGKPRYRIVLHAA